MAAVCPVLICTSCGISASSLKTTLQSSISSGTFTGPCTLKLKLVAKAGSGGTISGRTQTSRTTTSRESMVGPLTSSSSPSGPIISTWCCMPTWTSAFGAAPPSGCWRSSRRTSTFCRAWALRSTACSTRRCSRPVLPRAPSAPSPEGPQRAASLPTRTASRMCSMPTSRTASQATSASTISSHMSIGARSPSRRGSSESTASGRATAACCSGWQVLGPDAKNFGARASLTGSATSDIDRGLLWQRTSHSYLYKAWPRDSQNLDSSTR
mmetsp:Transcript_147676/g.472512  ORF Transcript_147676/g.472512 Transcript_147676/m.472512 type:complete len:268 (+) Transcript_147676:247-1050(+)